MMRKTIRLEYAFPTGKETITFETNACTNAGCCSHIEKIIKQFHLTMNKISKIEILEISE